MEPLEGQNGEPLCRMSNPTPLSIQNKASASRFGLSRGESIRATSRSPR